MTRKTQTRDLYDAYPQNKSHMQDYVDYQRRYASNIRESDRVIMGLVGQLIASQSAAEAVSVLDIGCSTGNLLRHLHRAFPSVHLTGGDLSDFQLEVCRQDGELAGISFLKLDLRALPSTPKYDVVIANAVLYGFDEAVFADCIANIAGTVKSGGCFLAFDFFHPWKQEVAIVEKTGDFPGGHPLHFRSYELIKTVLEGNGFAGIEFRPFSIPIDLPKPAFDTNYVETYTIPTSEAARLQFRGTIFQPWCHLLARRI